MRVDCSFFPCDKGIEHGLGMTHLTYKSLRHEMNHYEGACGRFLKNDFADSVEKILKGYNNFL